MRSGSGVLAQEYRDKMVFEATRRIEVGEIDPATTRAAKAAGGVDHRVRFK